MCEFPAFQDIGKSMESMWKLKYICIFSYAPLIHKNIENTRKPLSGSKISSSSSTESTTGFINPKNRRSCN